MKTMKKILQYCSEFIQKRYVFFIGLVIIVLSITYFSPNAEGQTEGKSTLSIAIINSKATTLPRLFLNH